MASAQIPTDGVSDERWNGCLRALGIAEAECIAEGRRSRGRRVYRYDDRIYKIAFFGHDVEGSRRNDLRGEFDIVRRCGRLAAVPEAYECGAEDDFEFAAYERLEGELLSARPPGLLDKLPVLMRLALVLLRLSRLGVSHNDLCPDNLVVRTDGSVGLIDFDQATHGSFLRALYRNFGSRTSGVVHASYLSLVRRLWSRVER